MATRSSPGKMAAAEAAGSAAERPDRPHCIFEPKEYKTPFTCYVCLKDSCDIKRYRCNHCDLACHKDCIRLEDKIKVGPGPDNIFIRGPEFTLFREPRITGQHSKNKKWAKYCVVCGMPIERHSYHHWSKDKKKDLNLHPCCAMLTRSDGAVKPPDSFQLTVEEKRRCLFCGEDRPKEASLDGPNNFFCWSYKLIGSKHRIHVHCFSEMVIQALQSILPSDDNDNKLKMFLRRRKTGCGIKWEDVAMEVIKKAVEQITGGIAVLEWIL